MALQVWLPLNKNGDLSNKGLADITVTNNGATYNTSGKIGGCYRFENGSGTTMTQHLNINKRCCDLFNTGDSFSYCCWAKIINYASTGASGLGGCVKYLSESSTVNNTTVKGGGFGFLISTSGVLSAYANPFKGSFGINMGTIPLNTWTHVCMTYEKSTKELSGYINGQFICKSTATSDWGSNGILFVFGRGSLGGCNYNSENYQNDIQIYNHCLSPKEVKEISKGLVIHYPLDDGNVTNIAYDCSGYCNNGTVSGTLTTSTDTPRYDKCSVFSNDAYISAGKAHTALLDEYTMSAWVNPSTDDTSRHTFVSCTQAGGMLLRIENKHFVQVTYLNSAYAQNISTTTISSNTWYHVVGTFKKGVGIKLYVNGVKESDISNSGSLTYNTSVDLLIGHEPNANSAPTSGVGYSGKISDVRLYATALSDADILDLYKESAYINYKGDVGCYLFYEGGENLLKYENTLLYTNPANIDTRGKYVIRNNELAMAFRATDTYFGSSTDKSKLLYNMFKPNTQYIFDLWIDTDDVVYNNNNVGDGFGIIYSDGTSVGNALYKVGSNPGETPKGFLHIVYVSTAGKTVERLSIFYYTSVTFYVRADSFITELSNTNIHKNGIIESSLFIEDTTVPYIGRANFNSNSLIEI